jgi:hypothetical protein
MDGGGERLLISDRAWLNLDTVRAPYPGFQVISE